MQRYEKWMRRLAAEQFAVGGRQLAALGGMVTGCVGQENAKPFRSNGSQSHDSKAHYSLPKKNPVPRFSHHAPRTRPSSLVPRPSSFAPAPCSSHLVPRPTSLTKKAPHHWKAFNYAVGVRGFEPPTATSRTWRANRATLHPEFPAVLGTAKVGKSNKIARMTSQECDQMLFETLNSQLIINDVSYRNCWVTRS